MGALVLVVATVALRNAAAWYGKPVPGLLVDAGGYVSSLGLPNWQGNRIGLRFPQSVQPAHAPELHGSRARTEAWDHAVTAAAARGYVDARVEGDGPAHQVRLRLVPLEAVAWWLYAGCSLIGGMLYAGAGLIARWASPSGRLARTFSIFGLSVSLFLLSLFDVHTQRSLTPAFLMGFSMVGSTLAMLALRLPDDVALLRRFPFLEGVVYGVAFLLGATAVVVYETGGDTRPFQSIFSAELGGGFFFFVLAFVVRYARAHGPRQEILRPLFLSMVPPYVAVTIGFFLAGTGILGSYRSVVDILSYPTMLFAPLGSAYAFVKHDLWGSRALLSRVGTHVVLGAIACMAAVAAGAALAGSIGLSFQDAMAGAAASMILTIALTTLARRISDSTLFRSRAQYKPTIEQLSTELLTITSPLEVARAIERTVRRWLPCDFVRLTLDDGKLAPPEHGADDEPVELTLQVAFAGRALAWLDVGPKRGGALFTSEDADLLRTIADQGALALAHAHAYQELEQRRQQQAQAWRGEREALVETVAAEIAHEIRYPINYFRSVFERGARGEHLDADDVDVGREEVDRLERLVSGLKRMAAHRLERSPLSLPELCGRAEALLRDALGERKVRIEIEPHVVVRCDQDKVLQVVVNLLSNALEAAGAQGHVGVSFAESSTGGELVVWDDGPGFVGDPARLFAPWVTTKPRGTGLGLAITQRLVRAHGWTVSARRRDERTVFVISVRKEDIVKPGSMHEQEKMDEVEVA
jgi:signal transduction histidine kinase